MSKIYKNNKTGYAGVCFENKANKYRAYISVHGEKIRLGYFTLIDEAIQARKEAEKIYKFNCYNDYKLVRFVINNNDERYEEAFYHLIKSALNYDGSVCFSTYAVNNIKLALNERRCFKSISEGFKNLELEDKEIYVNWLNGVSLRQLSNDYNINVYNINKIIKKCNKIIERELL